MGDLKMVLNASKIWLNANGVVIPSIRQSNRQNNSTESKWSSNSTDQT
jgi:hypothetical protein